MSCTKLLMECKINTSNTCRTNIDHVMQLILGEPVYVKSIS